MSDLTFVLTFVDPATSALRTVHSSDIPDKLIRHISAAVSLISDIEDDLRPVINMSGLTEDQINDLNFLEALKAAGVDNWEGYDNAVEIFNEMTSPADSDETEPTE